MRRAVLLAALAVLVLAAPARAVPPKTCSPAAYAFEQYTVIAHGVKCAFARKWVVKYLKSSKKPKGYTCHPPAAGSNVKVECLGSTKPKGDPKARSYLGIAQSTAAAAHPGHGLPTIGIANTQYTPGTINVTAGDLVEWVWDGPDTNHSVTSDTGAFDSDKGEGALQVNHETGATFDFYFAKAGSYAYHCKVHSSMHGTVNVSEAPATDGTPPKLTKVHGTVRGKRARVSFRVDEKASILAEVRRPGADAVLRASFRFVKKGKAHTSVGLPRGRVAVTVTARDASGNDSAPVVLDLKR